MTAAGHTVEGKFSQEIASFDTKLGPQTLLPRRSGIDQNSQLLGYNTLRPRVPIEHWVSNENGQVALPQVNHPPARVYEAVTTYTMRGGWPRSSLLGAAGHEQYTHNQPSSSVLKNGLIPSQCAPVRPHYSGSGGAQATGGDNSEEGFCPTRRAYFTSHPLPTSHPSPTSHPLLEMSEKKKMIAGRPYRHFSDKQLVDERNVCRENLINYNNASQSVVRMSSDERARLFLEILQPQNSLMEKSTDPIGCCGSRTIIEAPFTCEYGYSINIGDDIVIQAGCVVLDPCKITIGSRTTIGPGVKFFGNTVPMNPKLRNGSQGVVYGLPVTIEEDCFIGGGATILAGLTIRKGSIVGAGTVVSENVQPYIIVVGNPMHVLRGNTGDDLHKPLVESQNNAILSAARNETDIKRRAN